ncbi:MAG TPA: hemolysin family protein [Pyrinomonadaceae bacterium]|nr:hemolysin family protein [Pyrinomonadaceae bacterium]
MEIEIAIAVLLLAVLTFLATVDMAFVQLSDLSLRRLASDTDDNARVNSVFLRQILENRPRFRFALSAAIQILLIVFSVLVALITLRFFPAAEQRTELFLASLGIGLLLSGIFRQIIPRFITFRNPEAVLLSMLPFVRPFYGFLAFVADPFGTVRREKVALETSVIPNQVEEPADDNDDNNEDLHTLMEAGAAEGILEEEQRELIETIVDFGDTLANEIMTPRTEIEALPLDSTVREVSNSIIESKYSRLPVYRDQIDNVEGMIYVRDLLQFWADGKENENIEHLEGLLRPVNFVPETKSVAELLKEMQTARIQMAIVVDEYGGVAGLVTVEDILEELVGEIEDEDTEQEEIVEIIEGEDGYYDVLGSTEIDKIERLFDLEFEDDDFTTIAGLVISESGYVPKPGERLDLRELEIEILQADEKRINLLRLRRLNSPSDEDEAPTTES